MDQINFSRRRSSAPLCVSNAKYSFAFQWITGEVDIYVYQSRSELKQGLENHHMYESPTEASGRIVWCSQPKMLERVRGNA